MEVQCAYQFVFDNDVGYMSRLSGLFSVSDINNNNIKSKKMGVKGRKCDLDFFGKGSGKTYIWTSVKMSYKKQKGKNVNVKIGFH